MASPIVVSNLREHEVLPHPLVVFDGFVADFHALALPPPEWFVDARLDAARGAFWPVTSSGRFKALVLLPAPGKYAITLRIGGRVSRIFNVEYQPPVSRYVVRFYYQKCIDAHGEGFDAPPGVDNSDQAAMQKIRFNALLLQTATAEMFVHAGLSRETFAIEFAGDGLPHVYFLRSSFQNATARSIHDQELIQLVEKDIVSSGYDAHDELQFKHAVILGCSKYNPVTQYSDGHTALGGGKVGIFGSCGLHTWPAHLGEVSACCLNNLRIDTRRLMDDSGNRGTFWGNFSTGIGAFIHELGHSLGLGHSTSGIMSRGFDDMTRLFCAYEPDHRVHEPGFFQDFRDGRLVLNHQALKDVAGPEGAHWNIGSALQLVHCEWISKRPRESNAGPLVCWNSKVRGPVGHGNTSGTKRSFGMCAPSRPLGAIRVTARHYLDDLATYTCDELAGQDTRSHGSTQWFVLDPNESITKVEVRAMAWIDGMRVHTNRRSSPWYGGQGGKLFVLRPDEGNKINGFFGTRGDDFVGSLGVHCSSIAELMVSPLEPTGGGILALSSVKVGPIGYADQDGVQDPFEELHDGEFGAVLVNAGQFVVSVHTYTRQEIATANYADLEADGGSLFVLGPNEFITHVDVRAMCWVDALCLHTNQRSSPWYGGPGGDLQCLQPAPGAKIEGFFGTLGDNYVGCLGAYCVPIGPTNAPPNGPGRFAEPVETTALVSASASFALLSPCPANGSIPTHSGVARGVVVAVQDSTVMYVQSFDSPTSRSQLVQELQAFTYAGAQLLSFSLLPGEFLVQIDASLDPYTREVGGLCFHTSSRCSSWFGAYTDSQLYFLETPSGHVIKSIGGVPGATKLQDVVGEFSLRSTTPECSTPVYAYGDNPECGAVEDRGSYDLRVQSQSAFGIDSVYLLKKLEHEELEQHAWAWKSHPKAPRPQVWCLPQRMLEHHIRSEAGKTPTQILFSGYAIGAMDAGGGYGMAANPPVKTDTTT